MINFNKRYDVGLHNEAGRREWVKNTLAKVPAGKRLLDAGAGECQYKQFCSHLEYVSQDFSQYDGSGDIGLQTGKWDVSQIDIVSDIIDIPAPDASFDVILCTEVFEHIPYPIKAIEEFARLLKPGGQLILTAPFISFTHFAPYHYHTGFSKFFYEYHLPKSGFTIREITPNGNFFEVTAQEVRRTKQMSKVYSTGKVSFFDKIWAHLLLITLHKLSKRDKGSAEFAAYGLHVVADKRV